MNKNKRACSSEYPDLVSRRLKILFARTFIPETSTSAHGSFYERALRRRHDLITYGPDLPESMYGPLNFMPVEDRGRKDVPAAEAVRTDADIQLALGEFELARARAALGRTIAEGL